MSKQSVIKKNWVQRALTAFGLIVYLIMVTYIGTLPIWLTTNLIQIKCFQEILNIAYNYKKLPEIPLFRSLNWYFLFVANYFFCGEVFVQYLEAFSARYYILGFVFRYHRFLSFCLYMTGLIWFLNLLRKKMIRQQFSILAWIHFLCIIIVMQSYMIIQNMFEGLIWLVLPVTLVFINDIFAYIFGRLYGKTPLIEVSPKKTQEGFWGGALGTLILGIVIAWILCQIDHMVCPTKFIFVNNSLKISTQCIRNYIFQPIYYDLKLFSIGYYPFLFHVLILVLFASLIAPFGGFCASGFKRAFNQKDFGDFIPGHGGVMDRFDCQFLMASFVNVYVISFIKNYSVEKIFTRILLLSEDRQVEFYKLLGSILVSRGLMDESVNF